MGLILCQENVQQPLRSLLKFLQDIIRPRVAEKNRKRRELDARADDLDREEYKRMALDVDNELRTCHLFVHQLSLIKNGRWRIWKME